MPIVVLDTVKYLS